MHQDDRDAREAGSEYYFGPDLLVAPVLSPVTQRALYLPEGKWIDYWTGRSFDGRQTISVDAPLDRIPLFVRDGAILPKIPEDVMTLVPPSDFKDQSVHALDDRRVYEIYPGHESRTVTDFEGRVLSYEPRTGTLTITGSPARVSVRWRFAHPAAVTLNGKKLDKLTAMSDGISVEFPHQGTSTVVWR
jgi:alpha-D-xyloside xylohydrolase